MPLITQKSILFNACLLSKQKIKLSLFLFSVVNSVSFSFNLPRNWTVGLAVFFLVVQARLNFFKLFCLTSLNKKRDFKFFYFFLLLKRVKFFFLFFLFFRFFVKFSRHTNYKIFSTHCTYTFGHLQGYYITDLFSSSIILNDVFWHSCVRFSYFNKKIFLLFLNFFLLK